MARTVIQSDKLCHVVRFPYQTLRNTGYGSYLVQKLLKPDSHELRCMAYDLYPLFPSLKPCKHTDTTDTRYLN